MFQMQPGEMLIVCSLQSEVIYILLLDIKAVFIIGYLYVLGFVYCLFGLRVLKYPFNINFIEDDPEV